MPKEKPCAALALRVQNEIEFATGTPLAQPQADFIGCLIPALLASVPTFLSAFMKCMSGGGMGYEPGDRDRCS